MRFSSLVCIATLGVARGDEADPGWNLLATSVGDPVPRTCLGTAGIPDYVQGTYLVSGPAKFELNEYKFNGLFDGFGRVNRFEIADGQLCFTASWLNSTFLVESEKRGSPAGMLFEETDPPRPKCPVLKPMCNMDVPSDNDWVNAIQVGGKTLMLTDAAQMMEMDMETLETNGFKQWTDDVAAPMGPPVPSWIQTGHVATSGSAHPVQRPGTNTWVDLISVMGPVPMQKSYMDIFTFEGDVEGPQSRTKLASVKVDNAPYVHAFGVTPNYVVLPINHMMATPNFAHPVLLGKITEHWTGVHLVDKNGQVQLFAADFTTLDKMFYHVHIVNSFENATGVTLDVGAYQTTPFAKSGQLDIPQFVVKEARDSNPVRNVVRRLHLHLSGPQQGQTTVQDFPQTAGSSSDFFRVNPNHVGLPYCFYYAVEWWHNGADYANMAVIRRDVCKGGLDDRVFWKRPDTYPGEPIFIPGPSDEEDDGVVVFIALDGRKETTLFVTLDAKTMEELDVVDLNTTIPFTAHGQFFTKSESGVEIVL